MGGQGVPLFIDIHATIHKVLKVLDKHMAQQIQVHDHGVGGDKEVCATDDAALVFQGQVEFAGTFSERCGLTHSGEVAKGESGLHRGHSTIRPIAVDPFHVQVDKDEDGPEEEQEGVEALHFNGAFALRGAFCLTVELRLNVGTHWSWLVGWSVGVADLIWP